MADIGKPIRRVTVVPLDAPVPGVEEPRHVHNPDALPLMPEKETVPEREREGV